MSKPPTSPPSSDITGVHRDGTRPSKKLTDNDEAGADLERASREDAARPDYSGEESDDDRTG